MQRILAATLATLISGSTYADLPKNFSASIDINNLTQKYASSLVRPSKATTSISANFNLNAMNAVISSVFDPKDLDSYNYVMNGIIYDSLGGMHVVSYYFAKSDTVNTWNVYALVDYKSVGTGTIGFHVSGDFAYATGMSYLSFSPENGAASPQSFSTDFSKSTLYAGTSRVNSFDQDGYAYDPDFPSKATS
jgi:flagellar hook protein FlgE